MACRRPLFSVNLCHLLVLGSVAMLADRLSCCAVYCRLIFLFLPRRYLVRCFTCFWLWTTTCTGLAACSPF